MPTESELSSLEQQALLAVLRLHPNGYGVSIRDEIERVTARTVATGSLYAALDRLQRKGYVTPRQGEPTAERGGRRKLYFTVSAEGRRALDRALSAIDSLREGIAHGGVVA